MECDQVTSTKNRFSIWSDLLVEREHCENVENALAKKKKKNRRSKSSSNASHEMIDEWLPDRQVKDKTVRPGSKRSTKKNKTKKNLIKPGKSTLKSSKRSSIKKCKKSPAYKTTIEIASKLKETRRDLLFNVVKTLGDVMALRFLNETLDIESAGGLMTSSNSRRRTPGGVFFHLIKNSKHVTPEQLNAIFGLDQALNCKSRKARKKQKKKFEALADNFKSFKLSNDTPVEPCDDDSDL